MYCFGTDNLSCFRRSVRAVRCHVPIYSIQFEDARKLRPEASGKRLRRTQLAPWIRDVRHTTDERMAAETGGIGMERVELLI